MLIQLTKRVSVKCEQVAFMRTTVDCSFYGFWRVQDVAILRVGGRKRKQLPRDELSMRRDEGDRMGIGEGACEGGARLDDGVIAKASVGCDDGVDGIFCLRMTTMHY